MVDLKDDTLLSGIFIERERDEVGGERGGERGGGRGEGGRKRDR